MKVAADFFRKTGCAGLALASYLLAGSDCQPVDSELFPNSHRQEFNMWRYTAPAIDTVRVGAHGGMGTVILLRLVDCYRNGIPLDDISVYGGVLWSVTASLSEWSVANRSLQIDIPDFTDSSGRTNERGMDLKTPEEQ